MTGTDITVYGVQVVALGAIVWGAMKGISWKLDQDMQPGERRKRIKRATSWLLGPSAGAVAYGMGFLDVGMVAKHAAWGWVGAAFFGALGTATAWITHTATKAAPLSKLPK